MFSDCDMTDGENIKEKQQKKTQWMEIKCEVLTLLSPANGRIVKTQTLTHTIDTEK